MKTNPGFPSMHLAFRAPTQEHVLRFYEAGLQAGARPNGAPGLRSRYAPAYFVAFVLDPDGHNIEAVNRG